MSCAQSPVLQLQLFLELLPKQASQSSWGGFSGFLFKDKVSFPLALARNDSENCMGKIEVSLSLNSSEDWLARRKKFLFGQEQGRCHICTQRDRLPISGSSQAQVPVGPRLYLALIKNRGVEARGFGGSWGKVWPQSRKPRLRGGLDSALPKPAQGSSSPPLEVAPVSLFRKETVHPQRKLSNHRFVQLDSVFMKL